LYAKTIMQIKDTHKLLKELKEILCQIYDENLEGLYLYGSYVNGEEDAESDIDIAIVLKDFWDYWEEIQRTGQAISALSLKYDVSISPIRIKKIDWTHEDSPFLNNVRKECVPL
jgi:predicted nucleotidyltransferase